MRFNPQISQVTRITLINLSARLAEGRLIFMQLGKTSKGKSNICLAVLCAVASLRETFWYRFARVRCSDER